VVEGAFAMGYSCGMGQWSTSTRTVVVIVVVVAVVVVVVVGVVAAFLLTLEPTTQMGLPGVI